MIIENILVFRLIPRPQIYVPHSATVIIQKLIGAVTAIRDRKGRYLVEMNTIGTFVQFGQEICRVAD